MCFLFFFILLEQTTLCIIMHSKTFSGNQWNDLTDMYFFNYIPHSAN